jgi:hypothetical protein
VTETWFAPQGTLLGNSTTFNATTYANCAVNDEQLNRVWASWTSTSTTLNLRVRYDYDAAWQSWTSSRGSVYHWQLADSVETAEERAARAALVRAQDVERERVRNDMALAAEQAEATAQELLYELLSAEQRESWDECQAFEVVGSAGRRYEIRRGIAGNVHELDQDGSDVASLCCHPLSTPEGRLPVIDVVITQMLALISDEENFRRTANFTFPATSANPYGSTVAGRMLPEFAETLAA